MFVRISLILLALFSLQSRAQTIKESDTFAIIGEPKYVAGFEHYDYANPDAPKGGAITLAAIGTFDNFNRYAMRGNPGIRTETLYDTLFTTSDDEPGSYSPLIAEHTRYADDFSWMEITLNPRALSRWQPHYRQRCRFYLPEVYDRRGAAVSPLL